MLRAAIIEPSKEKRTYIAAILTDFNTELSVAEFHSKYDFLEHIDESATSFDLLFLNTTILQEGDGVELARQIRSVNCDIMITFVTESDCYYAEAFELFAAGYASYPIDIRYLQNCIRHHTRRLRVERRSSIMIKEKGEKYRRIFCRNIKYIESNNRDVILHMEDGAEIVSFMRLETVELDIKNDLFLRCHQSYLINLYFVDEMTASKFVIDTIAIPISRKYQKTSKERYFEYMFDKI